MGVDLSQYISTIGSFMSWAVILGPRTRKRRKMKMSIFEEEMIREKIRHKALDSWKSVMMTILYIIVMLSIVCLIMEASTSKPSMVSINSFKQGTSSTTILNEKMTITNETMTVRPTFGAASIVRMLLSIHCVERNPGPIYKMYLLDNPPIVKTQCYHITLVCSDGRLVEDCTILQHY